jgi:uncharacterized membrane protein YeiB
MDSKKKKAPHITGFLREFATIFTLTTLTFSLTGKILTSTETEILIFTTIHTLDGTGLPYSTIMQLTGFSLIMAAMSRFLFSEYSKIRMPYKWRTFLFLLATFFATLIFSIIFKWFPVNDIRSWFLFIPAFLGSYAIAIGVSLLLMKLEDKKYNKLLEEYKNKK